MRMGRHCTICVHRHRSDINLELMKREMTYTEIAARFGISIYAIKRHVQNHLKPIIQKVDNERREDDEALVIKTMDVLNKIISKLPEVIDTANVNQILRAVEMRARILGEDAPESKIVFVWGKGLGEGEDFMGDFEGDSRESEVVEEDEDEKELEVVDGVTTGNGSSS